MKKNYLKLLLLLITLISSSFIFAQTNRVKITVNWLSDAADNSVEVLDFANNALLTISSSGSDKFTATYDLGCLAKVSGYKLVLYSDGDGWDGSSSLVVKVLGIADQNIDVGTAAVGGGPQQPFNVNSPTNCNFPDTDSDGVIDFVDQDDDNDGILDTVEGLGTDKFSCQVPALLFLSGTDGNSDPTPESGTAGQVNAVYRFANAAEGYDVLVEIIEIIMHHCVINTIAIFTH